MKPSSAKAKGRRHQQRVVRDLLDAFRHLTEDDVRSTSMGCGGEDVLLSPAAQQCIPLSLECKNTEKLNIWAAIEQCASNAPAPRTPCVVFTRNHAHVYAAVPWDFLVALLARVHGDAGEEEASCDECLERAARLIGQARRKMGERVVAHEDAE